MYEDKSVSVETYPYWLKTVVLWLNNLVHTSRVSTCIIQNEAMTSTYGESLGKAHELDKISEM